MDFVIHVFNVGHGDSLLVEVPDSSDTSWIVIDCHNPDPSKDSPTLAFLKLKQAVKLKLVCLTHPDLDHFSGLEQLLDYYSKEGRSVEEFRDNILSGHFEILKSVRTSKRIKNAMGRFYKRMFELEEAGLITYNPVGYNTILFQNKNCLLKSIAPSGGEVTHYHKQVLKRKEGGVASRHRVDKNVLSIVMSLVGSKRQGLLCSDSPVSSLAPALERWLKECRTRRVRSEFGFVKVSHHGSKEYNAKALWDNFVEKGNSSACISSGQRFDDMPHIETVEYIVHSDVDLYCTTKSGCLASSSAHLEKLAGFGLSPTAINGIDEISSPITVISNPYHGNCHFSFNGKDIHVNTEFKAQPL